MVIDQSALLIAIGVIVGTIGTLIGVGGGFILMPVFFLLFPDRPPEELTAISLSIVFFNALSGSIAYARKGRIDYRSGILFALATIPGAVLGAMTTSLFSREVFDPFFSIFLIAASIYLLARPIKEPKRPLYSNTSPTKSRYPIRIIHEKDGTVHYVSYHIPLGMSMSVGVGYISSLLGIGGGIIHVPALIHILRFPVHIATATSQFILGVMAFFGSIVHLYKGDLDPGFPLILHLAPSVIVGAQLGAKLSHYIHGRWIIRILALALAFVGLRILIVSL